MYLNTSYVDIKQLLYQQGIGNHVYLNTSYVDIKHILRKFRIVNPDDLNTSYVDIKLQQQLEQKILLIRFKYILC